MYIKKNEHNVIDESKRSYLISQLRPLAATAQCSLHCTLLFRYYLYPEASSEKSLLGSVVGPGMVGIGAY